jgi:hypothetical protein
MGPQEIVQPGGPGSFLKRDVHVSAESMLALVSMTHSITTFAALFLTAIEMLSLCTSMPIYLVLVIRVFLSGEVEFSTQPAANQLFVMPRVCYLQGSCGQVRAVPARKLGLPPLNQRSQLSGGVVQIGLPECLGYLRKYFREYVDPSRTKLIYSEQAFRK